MSVDTFRGVVPQWTVADKIRKAREHAGLSQQQLADRLSVTRTSIVNWERGHTRPLRVLLGLLAAETGVDPDWLATEGAPVTIVRQNPDIPSGMPVDHALPPTTAELKALIRRRIPLTMPEIIALVVAA